MLRLRTTTGAVVPLPKDAHFIEICDLGGKLARLVYEDSSGRIRDIDSAHPDFVRYAGMMKVETVPLSRLP